MSDDLERTLHDSLSRHAARLGRPAGTIETVYERITRRRARRRAVAGLGSLAIAAVGVIGIATVGRGGSEPPASGALGANQAWSCTGMLGSDGTANFYSDCQTIDLDDVTTAAALCTAAPTTAPPATVAVSWADTTVAEPVVVAGPACGSSDMIAPATTYPIDTVPSPCGAPTTAVPTTTLEPAGTTTTLVFISACEPHEQIYTVRKGDSVYGISALFGIEPDALARYNEWPEGINHGLEPGDLIMIPGGYLKPLPPATTDEFAIDTTAVPASTVAP